MHDMRVPRGRKGEGIGGGLEVIKTIGLLYVKLDPSTSDDVSGLDKMFERFIKYCISQSEKYCSIHVINDGRRITYL